MTEVIVAVALGIVMYGVGVGSLGGAVVNSYWLPRQATNKFASVGLRFQRRIIP